MQWSTMMDQQFRRIYSREKVAAFLLVAMMAVAPVAAQQVTGTLGGPSATTTIDGKQLPPPPPTFGGIIPTPALDRVAKNGLRYTQFHSTALCSPTRAALITGRNHHSVGFGVVADGATGYPGYDSVFTRDRATIGRLFARNDADDVLDGVGRGRGRIVGVGIGRSKIAFQHRLDAELADLLLVAVAMNPHDPDTTFSIPVL